MVSSSVAYSVAPTILVRTLLSVLSAWMSQWLLLRLARGAEERAYRMSAEIIEDRSVLPLVALSLHAAALSLPAVAALSLVI